MFIYARSERALKTTYIYIYIYIYIYSSTVTTVTVVLAAPTRVGPIFEENADAFEPTAPHFSWLFTDVLTFEPTKKKSSDFCYHFLYVPVQNDLFDDFHHFFMTLFFMGRSEMTPTIFICHPSPRAYIYINILGVAKDTCYCVSRGRQWRRWLASVLACVFLG